VSGTTYCLLDGVTARSSAVSGVASLYIQHSHVPCAVSTVEPHLDPDRWAEVGAVSMGNAFGGLWEVFQPGHGFTRIGQPVTYSFSANRYTLASASELAVGVVREIASPDMVVLQSTGEVPAIDPAIIVPTDSDWDPGRLYYVSSIAGHVSLEPPADPGHYISPILIATDVENGLRNGVALPWTPMGGGAARVPQVVGIERFVFVHAAPVSILSGSDRDGKVLAYDPDQVDVFHDGLNLVQPEQFDATDGEAITFPTPRIGTFEVWTPSAFVVPVVPATSLKLDNIETMFDGARITFPLTAGGVPIPVQDAVNLRLWLDVASQEPVLGDPDGGRLQREGCRVPQQRHPHPVALRRRQRRQLGGPRAAVGPRLRHRRSGSVLPAQPL
jgi:hypothetical protein